MNGMNMNGNIKVITKKKTIGVLRESPAIKNNANITNNANSNNYVASAVDLLHCKRRMDWTKQWLSKNQFTLAENLLPEIKANEIYYFNDFFKMTEKQFRFLVSKLSKITQQEPQRKKKFFSVEERLAISLKYLATGEFHSCKHYCFKASQNVILNMIADICLEMYETLKDEFITIPNTINDWHNISNGFIKEFQLPNCLGTLIGRHILFKAPKQQNTRNTKLVDDNTIILMGIIDAHMNFIYIDIGQNSNLDDTTIFDKSKLKEYIENNIINLQNNNNQIPNDDDNIKELNNYFISNYSMPLKKYLMKEFYVSKLTEQQLYFDYKMCVVRQNGEYCLEQLTNIFPILMDPFKLDIETAKKVILGCIALYNFLKKTKDFGFNGNENFQKPGCFAQFIKQNEPIDNEAQDIRNFLMSYVNKNCSK